jgi:hypothetical protein
MPLNSPSDESGERAFVILFLAAKPRPENAFVYDEIASEDLYVEADPIGISSDINTYAYAGESPVSLFDPLGLCTVTLRFQPAAFVGWAGIYHAYIVTTDLNGSQTVFRGGPGSPTSDGVFGSIRGQYSSYRPRAPDWTTKSVPSLTVYSDDKSCDCENKNFSSLIDRINQERLIYGVYDWNSNSLAGTLLRQAGMAPSSLPLTAPGFRTNLPLNWSPPPPGSPGQR